jgi:segregation and condensation protein B
VPQIEATIEALLFVADGPVDIVDLASAMQVDGAMVEEALRRMAATPDRGICVVRQGPRAQLVTAPEASPAVERYLGIGRASKLSMASLETLAIIAYRQPITRAQVDAVRGVGSDAVIRSLLAKSLVRVVGRLEQAGRPELLGTTMEFLHYFGAKTLADLPMLPEPEGASG